MGFFDGPGPQKIDNWVCILERGTEYEVILAKNYLSNQNIPSNILSKRDSSYNLNIGETSMVYLYVPSQYEGTARRALEELETATGEGFDEEEEEVDDEDGNSGNPSGPPDDLNDTEGGSRE